MTIKFCSKAGRTDEVTRPAVLRGGASKSPFPPAGALLAVILAAGGLLVGCGQRHNEPLAAAIEESPEEAGAETVTTTSATSPQPDTHTTNSLQIAQAVARRLQQSPFATAGPALRQSYTRALIAQETRDYSRALAELQALTGTPGLSTQQVDAVQHLLSEIKAVAPNLAVSSDQAAAHPEVYPVVQQGQAPFATADPAVAESFEAAKLAFKIGDYDRALAELNALRTNTQLNWQQKYAVQILLDQTPQEIPGTAQ